MFKSNGFFFLLRYISSVQFSRSVVSDSLWPHDCSMPGLPVHHRLTEFTQTHVHQVGDAIQPSHPLSSPSPPAPILPNIRVFSGESSLHTRWPKYGSLASASFLPKNTQDWSPLEWTGWISLQSKGFSSLLQHHSSNASILQHSAFLMVQLTSIQDYWKTIAFTRQPLSEKISLSLLFNMLSNLS